MVAKHYEPGRGHAHWHRRSRCQHGRRRGRHVHVHGAARRRSGFAYYSYEHTDCWKLHSRCHVHAYQYNKLQNRERDIECCCGNAGLFGIRTDYARADHGWTNRNCNSYCRSTIPIQWKRRILVWNCASGSDVLILSELSDRRGFDQCDDIYYRAFCYKPCSASHPPRRLVDTERSECDGGNLPIRNPEPPSSHETRRHSGGTLYR